jgi:hypothetical protein
MPTQRIWNGRAKLQLFEDHECSTRGSRDLARQSARKILEKYPSGFSKSQNLLNRFGVMFTLFDVNQYFRDFLGICGDFKRLLGTSLGCLTNFKFIRLRFL